jgi:hypothetical protein
MIDYRPPYRAAVLSGLGVFALYLLTLSPSTAMWDTSEYIATAHILGIPHPPGNPLFVVLAKAWSLILAPLGLSVAVRINVLAAFTSAAAAGFYFLVVHRILWGYLRIDSTAAVEGTSETGDGNGGGWVPAAAGDGPRRSMLLVGTGAAVLLSATAFTVWNQSTVNEKVYTVSVLVIAAVTWLVLRWKDRKEDPGSIRYLLWAVYLLALGSTNHLMSVLPLPALVAFVALVSPGTLFNRHLWIRGVPLLVLGLSFNFFLPVRAAQDPVIAEGDPTCQGIGEAAVAIYTNGRKGCPALSEVLTRFQYQKPPLSERQAPLGDQLLNYYQYFDWQWARGLDPSAVPGGGRLPVTLLFLVLGGWGFWIVWKGDREAFSYLLPLGLTVTFGLVYYLNFKYGYSLSPEIQDATLHEVRERDYFFIASFGLWGALSGLGLTGIWVSLSRSLAKPRAHFLAAPVMLLALLPLASNWAWASRAGDFATRDWAFDVLMSVEPYGVIFTNGDNDTFPLWYLQEVEGIRQDVTVVVGQYLYTTWYPKQLQELTTPGRQRPFLAEHGGGVYDSPEVPPANPIISLSHEDMDRVVGGTSSSDITVPLAGVAVQYPSGIFLDRADQLSLAMIHDSIRERPIYFATPSGILGRLGLEPWSVRHGLAAKLLPRDLDGPQSPDLIKTTDAVGGEWFDVRRSMELVGGVYSYRGFRDREVWSDQSTLNIPWYFYATHLQLADAVERWSEGGVEAAEALREEAQAFRVTAQGGRRAIPEEAGAGL